MIKSFASLRVFSEMLTPEKLAAGLNVKTCRTWRKGERRGRTLLVHPDSGLEICSDTMDAELEEQVANLLESVRPDAEYIRRLNCDAVQLTLISYGLSGARYHLEPAHVELLGYLGASIDVDTYSLDE